MDDLNSLADIFQALDVLKGPIGWVALGVFALIRLYRLPEWQGSLPAMVRWENLPVAGRYGVIASLAALGAGLAAGANGLSWPEAITAGILAALAAIAGNKITKPLPLNVHVIGADLVTAEDTRLTLAPPKTPATN